MGEGPRGRSRARLSTNFLGRFFRPKLMSTSVSRITPLSCQNHPTVVIRWYHPIRAGFRRSLRPSLPSPRPSVGWTPSCHRGLDTILPQVRCSCEKVEGQRMSHFNSDTPSHPHTTSPTPTISTPYIHYSYLTPLSLTHSPTSYAPTSLTDALTLIYHLLQQLINKPLY